MKTYDNYVLDFDTNQITTKTKKQTFTNNQNWK